MIIQQAIWPYVGWALSRWPSIVDFVLILGMSASAQPVDFVAGG
jgi:hypothetical protein